jgi:hypothetical protein
MKEVGKEEWERKEGEEGEAPVRWQRPAWTDIARGRCVGVNLLLGREDEDV